MAQDTFNTFQAARALESAGVERGQAETIVKAIQRHQDYATKSDVTALQSDSTAVRADVVTVQSDVAALRTDVTALQTDVAALRTDVTALQSDVAALRTDVTALQSDVAALRTDMAALETRLTNRMYAIAIGLAATISAFGLFT